MADMHQENSARDDSFLKSCLTGVGNWLLHLARESSGESVDGCDADLLATVREKMPDSESESQLYLARDATRVVALASENKNELVAAREEVKRILDLPFSNTAPGPLLHFTIPAILEAAPRGDKLNTLQAVRLIAEQVCQNIYTCEVAHGELQRTGLSEFARTLEEAFSSEALLVYHSVIENVPVIENGKGSLFSGGLQRTLKLLPEPEMRLKVLDALSRISEYFGQTPEPDAESSEWQAHAIFSLTHFARGGASGHHVRMLTIFADFCEALATQQMRSAAGLIGVDESTPQGARIAYSAEQEHLNTAMIIASFMENVWAPMEEEHRVDFKHRVTPAGSPMGVVLDALETLAQEGDLRRFACLVTNLETVIRADDQALGFFVTEDLVMNLSRILPLEDDTQHHVFESCLHAAHAGMRPPQKFDVYARSVMQAFKTAQAA